MATGAYYVTHDDDRASECQNCGLLYGPGYALEVAPIDDLFERVAAGEPMPSGQCVECGALCQLVKAAAYRKTKREYCDDHWWRWFWHSLFGHSWTPRRVYFGAPDAYVEFNQCYREVPDE